jgi:hypothetical protein
MFVALLAVMLLHLLLLLVVVLQVDPRGVQGHGGAGRT